MAEDVPKTPQTGPEVQGHGQPPATPEPLTPEQQVAARAEEAVVPEEGQLEGDAGEGLDILAAQTELAPQTPEEVAANEAAAVDLAAQAEHLREVPPQPAQPAEATTPQQDPMEAYLNRLNNMPPNQLQRSHDRLDKMIKTKTRLLNNTYDDLRAQQFENEIAALETQKEITEDVMQERNIEVTTNGATTTQQTNAERQQVMEQEAREFAAIQKMTPEQITAKKGELEASRDYLNDRSQNAPDPKDRQAAKDALVKVRGQLKIVEGVAEGKKAEKEESDRKGEAEKAKEGHEQALKDNTEPGWFREMETLASNKLKENQGEINRIKEELQDLADGPEKTQKEKGLVEAQKTAVELNKEIKFYKEGLEGALQRERDEFTLTEKFTEDDLERISRKDYGKMSEDEQSRYMNEVRKRNQKLTAAQGEGLRTKIMKGEPLGIKDRALYADYFARKLINQKGREKGDWETMQMLVDRYPEMSTYVMDKVINNSEQMKAFKEQNPSDWEKIVKFAGRNKHWLMILFAIIAAGATGIGVAAGPVLGGIAGAGGTGAAGADTGWLGSRRAA